VLAWAHRVLSDYGGLTQELSELREGLAGQLRHRCDPSQSAGIGPVDRTVRRDPLEDSKTRFRITSQTSIDIQRELRLERSRS
jgi:hypothetical protein